ncbi:homeobox protein PKNOX1-like isoform X2 [Centruroides vittatus]|uniref:homeobox protein PKNOX1-like isoform X2 n=1 Tax=Centruroides vittatus TaxID=120091 RepID=UPI00350FCD26
MQEPSAVTTQNITVVPQTIPLYQDTSHHIIGQCADVPEEQITSSQGVVNRVPTAQPVLDPQAQAQFEADKRAVYKHPLFPLLALLFEKCELATQSAEVPSSESFNMDIQAFVQHQERDRKPFFSEDPEVDGLMVKAIQVLRIHLLELEKVQELCKDFCSRYIACLKNKMQSENLLRPDYPGLNSAISNSNSNGGASSSQPQQVQVVTSNGSMSNLVIQSGVTQSALSMATLSPSQIVSGGTVYQMVHTPQGIVAQPIQIQSAHIQQSNSAAHVIHGSTPLSQIGASPSLTQESRVQPIAPRTPVIQSGDEDEELLSKKKQKRGVLPKHATSVMRSWLFQHIVHPYPTEDEKRQIAAQTNLTLLQVNNWFINARRRILQPMLDASNPETSHKTKKNKSQSTRPVQRFWPETIASLQPQMPNQTTETNCDHQQNVQCQGDSQAGTSGVAVDHCNNYSSNSRTVSPNGSISQNCSDTSLGEDRVSSSGSVGNLSLSSNCMDECKK